MDLGEKARRVWESISQILRIAPYIRGYLEESQNTLVVSGGGILSKSNE